MDSSKSDVWDSDAETRESRPDRLSKHGLIRKGLAPAVGLWLRSQVEHIKDLEVEIEAGDRQILSGCIPQVRISARKRSIKGCT